MKKKVSAAVAAFVVLMALGFLLGIVLYIEQVAGSASATPTTPGLPTIPPPLPTQVVNGDGSRLNCTPNYQYCWLPPNS